MNEIGYMWQHKKNAGGILLHLYTHTHYFNNRDLLSARSKKVLIVFD